MAKKQATVTKDAPHFIDGQDFLDKERRCISVSPAIDIGLGGGVQEGTWCLLSGRPKCGKTVTALQIAANAQQQYGSQIVYGSVEHRIKKRDLEGIHGLHVPSVKFIESTPEKIMTGEDFLTDFIWCLKNIPNCVLIVDSASQLCPGKELEEALRGDARSGMPKLMAAFVRQAGTLVRVNNCILIMINHLIDNTKTGFSYEDGGNKKEYQGDTKMRCTSSVLAKKTKDSPEPAYGQHVKWKVYSSSYGGPGAVINSFIRYGYGIDDVMELIMLGIDLGIIHKPSNSGWHTYTWEGGETKQNGSDNLRTWLLDNPEQLELLRGQVMEFAL